MNQRSGSPTGSVTWRKGAKTDRIGLRHAGATSAAGIALLITVPAAIARGYGNRFPFVQLCVESRQLFQTQSRVNKGAN